MTYFPSLLKKTFLFVALISFMNNSSMAYPQQAQLPDGAYLRYDYRPAANGVTPLSTLILLQGRSSYIEKFEDTLQWLTEAGHEVWIFDWRGSGGSSREIATNPQKVYIDSYDTYIKDLDYMLTHVIKTTPNRPIILFGISLGGHIGLRYIEEHPTTVQGAFLISSMLSIHTKPYPLWLGRWMVTLASHLGLKKSYVVGYGDYNVQFKIDPKKIATTDIENYKKQLETNLKNMVLVTSGPTYGWVYETFKSIDKVNKPQALKQVAIPVMMIQAGEDTVIDTLQDQKICALIPQCRLKTYPSARHNILCESATIQKKLQDDFKDFVAQLKTASVAAN